MNNVINFRKILVTSLCGVTQYGCSASQPELALQGFALQCDVDGSAFIYYSSKLRRIAIQSIE